MSRSFAIIQPTSLLGQELREALEAHPELWSELKLLSPRDNEVGTLTEVRGTAAMVQALDPDTLSSVALAFLCGALEDLRPLMEDLPPSVIPVLVAPEAGAEHGRPLVAGVNLGTEGIDDPAELRDGSVLLSPHPAVVATSHLLAPLRGLGIRRAAATVVEAASGYNQDGLDELFEQTRAVLAFASEKPQEVFGHQLAFNLLPVVQPLPHLGELTRQVLGTEAPISLHRVRGGIFHGLSLSLHLELEEDPSPEELRQRLEDSPTLAAAENEDSLGPVEVAGRNEILLGRIERDPAVPGGYWVWAVTDNLTVGGAHNAVAIARAAFGPSVN